LPIIHNRFGSEGNDGWAATLQHDFKGVGATGISIQETAATPKVMARQAKLLFIFACRSRSVLKSDIP
jgi:hypothetical protein